MLTQPQLLSLNDIGNKIATAPTFAIIDVNRLVTII